MDKQRSCLYCGRTMAKYQFKSREGFGYGNGYFCSRKCGYEWAVKVELPRLRTNAALEATFER